MSPVVAEKIVRSTLKKASGWLATRGKGVSKHIGHHTHSVWNAAIRNKKYWKRLFSNAPHTVFRDPRPKKLIEKLLKDPSKWKLQKSGRVGDRLLVAKKFNRAIGWEGEKILAVVIDVRTGRIVTAFAAATYAAIGLADSGARTESRAYFGDAFETRVSAAVLEIDKLITDWQNEGTTVGDVIEFVLDLIILGPDTAGDEFDNLRPAVLRIMNKHFDALLRELQEASKQSFSTARRDELAQHFYKAVVGAGSPVFE